MSKKTKYPPLPKGCGYTGRDFGANYTDSECFGGQLYDLDNCDEPGTLNEPLNYLPCPQCRHEEWMEGVLEECEEAGWTAQEDGEPRECPFKKETMKYPDDLERCRAAWLKGWDEAEADEKSQTEQSSR